MGDLERPDEATAHPKQPDNGDAEQSAEPPVRETQRTEKEVDLDEPRDVVNHLTIKQTVLGNEQIIIIQLLSTINGQQATMIKLLDRIAKAVEAK